MAFKFNVFTGNLDYYEPSTSTATSEYAYPVVESPSTIERVGDDLGEPELVYEFDFTGDLDIVSTWE